MANKQAYKNAKPFTKNDPRINKKGRPKVPEDLKAVRTLHKDLIERKIAYFWHMSKADLKDYIADDSNPAGDSMIASVCLEALVSGDHTRLNFLLDRTIGKVKEVKEIVLPKPTVVESIDGQRTLLLGDAGEIEEEKE